MTITFEKPQARTRKPGGDDSVERDGNGRPRIIVICDKCDGSGKLPSSKRAGSFIKCSRCVGEGSRKVSYTRVTTFIDVLDSKDTLMDWQNRMVLVGVAMDNGFLKGVPDMDPEDAADKKVLSKRAEAAKELAGASKKADKGTELHEYSEIVDNGAPLPPGIDLADYLDMEAYTEATKFLEIRHMEELVVCDWYKTAGTPDRVSTVKPGIILRTPDGEVIPPGMLLITDLKTGRVDYGGLKMAMQLGIYSRSYLYKQEDGTRVSMGDVHQKWGLIMHLPAGSGKCTLYWANLELGWAAVAVASQVRDMRRLGRQALQEVRPEQISLAVGSSS